MQICNVLRWAGGGSQPLLGSDLDAADHRRSHLFTWRAVTNPPPQQQHQQLYNNHNHSPTLTLENPRELFEGCDDDNGLYQRDIRFWDFVFITAVELDSLLLGP